MGWRRHGRSSLSSGLRRSRTQAHLPPPPPHIIQCMQSSLAPPSLAQPCISGGELRESVQNVLRVSTSPGLQVSWSRCRLYLEMADDVPSIWAALSRDTAAQQRRGCQQTSAASISKVNQYEPRAAALHVGGELDNFAQPSPPLARPGRAWYLVWTGAAPKNRLRM